MTMVTIFLPFVRVIKTADPLPGNTAQPKGIIVVLPAQPFVSIEFYRKVDLMTGTAKFGRFV